MEVTIDHRLAGRFHLQTKELVARTSVTFDSKIDAKSRGGSFKLYVVHLSSRNGNWD